MYDWGFTVLVEAAVETDRIASYVIKTTVYCPQLNTLLLKFKGICFFMPVALTTVLLNLTLGDCTPNANTLSKQNP